MCVCVCVCVYVCASAYGYTCVSMCVCVCASPHPSVRPAPQQGLQQQVEVGLQVQFGAELCQLRPVQAARRRGVTAVKHLPQLGHVLHPAPGVRGQGSGVSQSTITSSSSVMNQEGSKTPQAFSGAPVHSLVSANVLMVSPGPEPQSLTLSLCMWCGGL